MHTALTKEILMKDQKFIKMIDAKIEEKMNPKVREICSKISNFSVSLEPDIEPIIHNFKTQYIYNYFCSKTKTQNGGKTNPNSYYS
jgi:hypothetical protein